MSFFKPSVFIKTFLFFCAISATMFSISCKQLASFDPNVEGARVVVSNTISAPTGIRATNGLKRKISLEWTPVSGARYYEIYYAESATAEFTKIGETAKSSYDDNNVGTGKTFYYKVCAVKSNGTQSPFSITTKGTSLAKPIISGGDMTDYSANITWFMENAEKNYDDLLKFEVYCGEKSQTLDASAFPDGSYNCTFKGLAGSTDHQIYVRAYLSTDQQSYEESAKVNKTTLTSYMPLAPVFNASEGESAKGIWLYITLPEMVMVNTVTTASPDKEEDVPYPVYFEIYRKSADSDGSYDKVCDLYYNGSTEPPTTADYQDTQKGYVPGATITWFDDKDLQGGVKYEYMIRSFVDCGYSKVVCPEGKEYKEYMGTAPDKATKGVIGWKSAHPSFKLNYSEESDRTFKKDENGNNTKVLSYKFGFSADWQDLGKADKYQFAIKQTRTLDAEDSDNGTDTWLENGGNIFFATIGEVNSHLVKFGSASGLRDDEKGVYAYTLYIVSKNVNGASDINDDNVLDSVAALDAIQVTPDVNLPEANLTVEGGYANKVVLKISSIDKNDANVTYKITRTWLEGSHQEGNKEFDLDKSKLYKYSNETCYDDMDVQGNCRYSYILTATNPTSGAWAKSQSQEAETLGTPEVDFKRAALSYDSVTITFDGVLAAKKYTVTLGASDGFGGGEKFEITKDDSGEWKSDSVPSSGASAKVEFSANKFTVTINKPYGYNDAELAGNAADLTVTAHSKVDNALSVAKPVNVLGPALLNAQVNTFAEAKEDSISLTWNAVAGAKGYLIRRVMYDDVAMTSVADGSGITYYYEVSSKKITASNADVGDKTTVFPGENNFTLTDTYEEADKDADADVQEYQKAQSKIAWGLPFRYIVLPVFEKGDFDFKDDSLELTENGKVAYKKLAPTEGTATYGYGLKVQATKSESATNQEVSWEKPFYGENLTPKVYRRKFANRDKNEWEAVNATVKSDAITYSPSGDDRYCAWEYVVKYRNDTSDKIAQSYVDWLKNSDHDETRYDYGSADKEKLNKGYLLAMDYSAYYGGGESPSKTDDDYYSEDVEITKWYYNDRTLGPDKVELKVLSLDLSSGWQTVGTLDSEITSFTASTLTDTTVEANFNDKVIKLKPTEITNNKNGKGTTDGPLKVLRSAKHYYGLNLSRGGNEPQFDYKNYEEYAYRQITDEELIKSTMLVVAEVIKDANLDQWDTGTSDKVTIISKASVPVNGMKGSFDWSQCSHSAFWWTFSGFVEGWKELPYGEYASLPEYKSNANRLSHFITVDDNSSRAAGDDRGKKDGTDLKFLCYRVGSSKSIALFGCKWGVGSFSTSAKIPLTITSDIKLETYNATVNFASSDNEFVANVTRTGYTGADLKNTNGKNDISYWIPANINGIGYKGQDSAYGWWDN